MILVVDASVLITLAKVGRLQLLQQLASEIVIPNAVYDEVVIKGGGHPGHAEVSQASWISHRHVRDHMDVLRLQSQIGRGESEAIILAKELTADFVILDDA